MKHSNETTRDEIYAEAGVDIFDAPVPGESLTSDPNATKPWEQPPQFTDQEAAVHHIFMMLTNDDNYEELLDTMRNGAALSDLAQVFLFQGFSEGAWTPDLMLLLVEPTIYILIWLADQAGIEPVLDNDYDAWEEEENLSKETSAINEDIQRMKPKQNMPSSLLSKMDSFEAQQEGVM
jgi:hypothetical protein